MGLDSEERGKSKVGARPLALPLGPESSKASSPVQVAIWLPEHRLLLTQVCPWKPVDILPCAGGSGMLVFLAGPFPGV